MSTTNRRKAWIAFMLLGAMTVLMFAEPKGFAQSPTAPSSNVQQTDLSRPLIVRVVSWPGYAGGIVANNGFKPNKNCIFWSRYGLNVEFRLIDDVAVNEAVFLQGGVDIVWSTADSFASQLPGMIKGGIKARAIMQVDWSRGGDAIVADREIERIDDLNGKKIALAALTPSQWLLESVLEQSALDNLTQAKIMKNLIAQKSSPDARVDFVAGRVDVAVMWEPDVTIALQSRPGAHILASTKTLPNLIADVMISRDDFIREHPRAVRAFIQGWLDGTKLANQDSMRVATLLMDNEPLYRDLGLEHTLNDLATVRWADLEDNAQMFGLRGGEAIFDQIFDRAGRVWVKRGYIKERVAADLAKDDQFLRAIYAEVSSNQKIK